MADDLPARLLKKPADPERVEGPGGSTGSPRAEPNLFQQPVEGRLDLCGVRPTRGSPVVFVDPGGHSLDPLQIVVVALPEGEALAIVVVAPGQLVENEARVEPGGRVVRVASAEDIVAFALQHGAEADAIAPMHADLEAAGLPPGWSDWLVPLGAQPSVLRTPETNAELRSARALIDRLFPEPHRGES